MPDKVRLIARVDDAGSSWASNIGCLRACVDGIARSVEVMMPCAWVPHAARLFNDRPEIDIGIHLTLTSEWDAVKWRPITQASSLVGSDGNFFPLLSPQDGDTRPCLRDHQWTVGDVAREFRAQIELGLAMFRQVSHVSAHMVKHFSEFDGRVGTVVADLCKEYGLMDDPFGYRLPRFAGYPPHPRDARQRTAVFAESLSRLLPGDHIFIDHPAAESEDLEALGHAGYEDVRADRVSCLETLTNVELRREIDRLGIELISYRDLQD